ncbi:hypothetical protein KDL45_00475, partial [bacterium]|nr:hypothetical protein [bacterium]
MRSCLYAILIALFTAIVAGPSLAQTTAADSDGGQMTGVIAPADEEEDAQAEEPAKDPPFGEYGKFLKHTENLLLSLDLWGSSATIPEGFGVVFMGWQTRRAWKRFDEHRKIVDIVPVIDAPDPFEQKGKFFELVLNIDGRVSGYGAGFQYGLTDRITLGIDTYWAIIHLKLKPEFRPGSSEQVGIVTLDDIYTVLELVGRPELVTEYDSDPVDFGDTTISAKWNYFRAEHVSTAMTLGLVTPTAHEADPNENIIFGLGPDLDTGVGTWGIKGVHNFDIRPPDPVKAVTFSLGLEGAIFLEDRRETPTFGELNTDVRDYLQSQGVDVDIFPDLSDIGNYYYYTPPPYFAASFGIGAGPLSIAYRHGFGGAANYRTNSEGLKTLIEETGLVGYGDDGKLIFNLVVPLTPLYFPGLVNFNFE